MMFVDDWTREDITKMNKWLNENFNLKDLQFKNVRNVDFHDFISGTDHSLKETYENKEVHNYYLHETDGPDWEHYNEGQLLLMKIFQLGVAVGITKGPEWIKRQYENDRKVNE